MPTWNELFTQEEYRWTGPHRLVVQLAERLQGHPGAHILDLGCGAGRHLVYLASLGFAVQGMDLAVNGLRAAAGGLKDAKVSAGLLQADMTALPYAGETFDALVSVHVIFHNPAALLQRTMDEIFRVVKPGGLVFLTFNSTRSYRYGRGTELEPGTYIPDVGGDAGIPHHFSDLADLSRLLARFQVQKVEHTENRSGHGGGLSCHWEVTAVR